MKKPASSLQVYLNYLPKCFQKSSKWRIKLKNYIKYNRTKKTILVMTLLVKDEEKLIEKNIRFHYAMGVNAFVVTIHNSTDKTLQIVKQLKKEGIPIEIFTANDLGQKQAERVHKMILIAKKKYHADWIINADADEFYYSKDFNLKRSILKYCTGNVLLLDSTFAFPDNKSDRLECPYFITNYIPDFWYELYPELPAHGRFVSKCSCSKVIHTTKNYIHIHEGNHGVNLRHKKVFTTNDLVLYHFTDGNYADYEEKVIRYKNAFGNEDKNIGCHIKNMIDLYNAGKLKEHYNTQYNDNLLNMLLEHGIVTKDYSLINFMKYNNIL